MRQRWTGFVVTLKPGSMLYGNVVDDPFFSAHDNAMGDKHGDIGASLSFLWFTGRGMAH